MCSQALSGFGISSNPINKQRQKLTDTVDIDAETMFAVNHSRNKDMYSQLEGDDRCKSICAPCAGMCTIRP